VFATTFAAVAAFEVVLFGKDHEPLLVEIIVVFGEFGERFFVHSFDTRRLTFGQYNASKGDFLNWILGVVAQNRDDFVLFAHFVLAFEAHLDLSAPLRGERIFVPFYQSAAAGSSNFGYHKGLFALIDVRKSVNEALPLYNGFEVLFGGIEDQFLCLNRRKRKAQQKEQEQLLTQKTKRGGATFLHFHEVFGK
jgi:hypothetical protein